MSSKRLKNALKMLGKCTQNARKTPPQNREKRPQELLLQFDTRSRNIFSHTDFFSKFSTSFLMIILTILKFSHHKKFKKWPKSCFYTKMADLGHKNGHLKF